MIKVKNLKKNYDDFEAVRGIDFDVSEGEVFGLLGPNGAGKTTTVEILEGLIEPSSGTATISDLDVVKNSKKVCVSESLDLNPLNFTKEDIATYKKVFGITFEEEKEVAVKAPIDGIKISNLKGNLNNQNKKISNDKFSYSIKVADFYYKKTANLMIDRIKTETSITNIKLIELTKTNYRVLLGPFNDINSLKESFEKMNSLNFENLEILKNV